MYNLKNNPVIGNFKIQFRDKRGYLTKHIYRAVTVSVFDSKSGKKITSFEFPAKIRVKAKREAYAFKFIAKITLEVEKKKRAAKAKRLKTRKAAALPKAKKLSKKEIIEKVTKKVKDLPAKELKAVVAKALKEEVKEAEDKAQRDVFKFVKFEKTVRASKLLYSKTLEAYGDNVNYDYDFKEKVNVTKDNRSGFTQFMKEKISDKLLELYKSDKMRGKDFIVVLKHEAKISGNGSTKTPKASKKYSQYGFSMARQNVHSQASLEGYVEKYFKEYEKSMLDYLKRSVSTKFHVTGFAIEHFTPTKEPKK